MCLAQGHKAVPTWAREAHDWKSVDWDIKKQYRQTQQNTNIKEAITNLFAAVMIGAGLITV